MKKYYLAIPSVLFLFFGFVSCSDNESKTETQNQVASRSEVPIQNGVVLIGTQVWMTKNLNLSRYRNGDPIPHVQDPTAWAALTTGAWCYYLNNTANGPVYGKLYNWYAVNDPRGLAPTGYHVPSDAEWTTLTTFLGGANVAGNKMKATTGWTPYSEIINTNSSRFTGLPGGSRSSNGLFNFIGRKGRWWSSTEVDTPIAYIRTLNDDTSFADRNNFNKAGGFSVRCIRD